MKSTGETTLLDDGPVACTKSYAVSDWMAEIKRVWARGAASTLELAKVVSAAKNQLCRHYGHWSQLWRSKEMPVSKSTADRLAQIGLRMGWIDSATSLNLPRGWNILYCLARLDRPTLERLIEQREVHPELTLREARELAARFRGKSRRPQSALALLRQRLRRVEEFVRANLPSWSQTEKKLLRAKLAGLVEQFAEAVRGPDVVFVRVRAGRAQHEVPLDHRLRLVGRPPAARPPPASREPIVIQPRPDTRRPVIRRPRLRARTAVAGVLPSPPACSARPA